MCDSLKFLACLVFAMGIFMLKTDVSCQESSKELKVKEMIISRSSVGEDTCTTAFAKTGSCIPLIRCRSYWGRGNMPELENSTCGNETLPRICCPLADDDDEVVTTQLPSTQFVAISPTTFSPQNHSAGKSWRKSFRSFPENCGQSGATFRRIIGGQDSAPGAWPWMAVIFLVRRGIRSAECGGALITSSHVLTAAHCVVTSRRGQTLNPRQLLIRLGELDLNSNDDGMNPIDVPVKSIIRHERFSLRTFQNDIAILELDHSVNFNDEISPICLPFTIFLNDDLADRNAIAVGWGSTRFGGPGSSKLQEVSLRIWQNDLCREIFRRDVPITNANLCAGDGDKDACRGDSGGPLMLADQSLRFYMIGIVSFGKKCAEPGIPGVYARVTEFLDWVEQKIG